MIWRNVWTWKWLMMLDLASKSMSVVKLLYRSSPQTLSWWFTVWKFSLNLYKIIFIVKIVAIKPGLNYGEATLWNCSGWDFKVEVIMAVSVFVAEIRLNWQSFQDYCLLYSNKLWTVCRIYTNRPFPNNLTTILLKITPFYLWTVAGLTPVNYVQPKTYLLSKMLWNVLKMVCCGIKVGFGVG